MVSAVAAPRMGPPPFLTAWHVLRRCRHAGSTRGELLAVEDTVGREGHLSLADRHRHGSFHARWCRGAVEVGGGEPVRLLHGEPGVRKRNDEVSRHVAALRAQALSALEARLSAALMKAIYANGSTRQVLPVSSATGDRRPDPARFHVPAWSARSCDVPCLTVRNPCPAHRTEALCHPFSAFRRSSPRWLPAARRSRPHPATPRARPLPGR